MHHPPRQKILFVFMLVIVLAALLWAPFVLYPVFLMKMLCFALFACAFNLLIGYTGLLSFGHAAFFGCAAYVTGYVLRDLHLPVVLGLLAGTAVGALIGLVMGLLAIRRQGIYFTMITLALAQMLYFVCVQTPFTGGEDGLQGIPRGTLFGVINLESDLTLYFVVLAIAVAAFGLIVRVIYSPFGHVLKAIKENEARAISLGYDIDKYKLLAFVLSAALSGLAGSTKALVLGFATLTDVHWTMSGLVVLMTLIGGLGTTIGPIVGAVVIVMMENQLGEIGDWLANVSGIDWFHTLGDSVTIATGFVFIICVLGFRRGLAGEVIAFYYRHRQRQRGRAKRGSL